MPDNLKAEQEIMEVHTLFWQSLADRNLDLRFSVCSDNITFIGTGLKERAVNKAEYRRINEKGFKQSSGLFQVEFLWSHLSLSQNVAWVECEVLWKQVINNVELKELVRNTTILKNEMNKWWIVHVHGSVPDYRLNVGEFMQNEATSRRNRELEKLVYERTEELNKSLQDLKAAQARLIHAEKMASLGELTAGIAHEIQNPLNFVNNFSEVNEELLEELKLEKSKPVNERDEQAENDLVNDIAENEKKINHHGKRADSIVKGMLQHSRTSTGQKDITDINALADEYLRLAFHGLRAKDKDFNAIMKTDLDFSIPKIDIVTQDMGRVLLNLFNNAFYAVTEKKKQQGFGFEPVVWLRTRGVPSPSGEKAASIEIVVKDNGNGVPQKIAEKIFQPFFTTKPTGYGTGLGLSLSYDIVKAHGGEIIVNSMEGEGAEFLIVLPVSG